MLKIFFVVMLLSPGMSEPLIKKEPVASYEACLEQIAKIKAKAEELNSRGGPVSEFRVLTGCEFISEKNDPS